jgi:hypothetical protein
MIHLPAGQYWIGDPCYIFHYDHRLWEKVLEETDFFKKYEFFDENMRIIADHTAHGDGEFYTPGRTPISVDAGLIGIATKESIDYVCSMLDEDKKVGLLSFLGWVGLFVEFEKTFPVDFDDGQFYFGDIFIDTREIFYEEEDEGYYEYYEEEDEE